MARGRALFLLSGVVAAGLASNAWPAERSGCVTCHLDAAMLARNVTPTKVKKSALQSGKG
jgi:hypothetical protein